MSGERTSGKDVVEQVALLRKQMERMGLVDDRQQWDLRAGNKTLGNSWTLRLEEGNKSPGWLPQGFLGATAPEAVGRLQIIREVFGWLEVEELMGEIS